MDLDRVTQVNALFQPACPKLVWEIFMSVVQTTLIWHNLKWWTKMTKTKVIFKVNIPFMTGMIDRIDVFKILFSILNTKIIHSVIKLCFQALIMVFIIFYGIQ